MNYTGFDFVSTKINGKNLHNFSMKDHTHLERMHNLLQAVFHCCHKWTSLHHTKNLEEYHHFAFLCMSA